MVLSKNRPDLMLLVGAIVLVGAGLIAIYSASGILAIYQHEDGLYFLKRQIVWLSSGTIALLIGRRIDYHIWAKWAKPLLILGVILLLLTLHPLLGRRVNEAQRWLKIGPLAFQTSEYVKVALVIYLAESLSRKKREMTDFKIGFLVPLSITVIVSILIMMQPHLGMTLLIIFLGGAMVFVAGAKIVHFFYLLAGGLPVLYLLIFKFGYGKERILSFVNPWADPLHRGYQIIQSFIALGGGGFLGKGLGNSAQKLFYLPNPHTDFIFAIIGEETGFLGAGAIVFLFLWLAFWGMRIACNSKDSFGQLLGFGLISAITIQALLNMGVACGIFPITGLPLPLVSVGGSGLLFAMFSIGVILNISRASPKANSGGLACEY